MAKSITKTQTGFFAVGGTELFYEIQGAGPPLVFVHAGIADHRMWDAQIAGFAGSHRLIRYDVRGFGRSLNPTGEYVDHEELAALLDHLAVGPAILIGASNGGRIAINLALAYPERVSALVLVATSVEGYEYGAAIAQGWEAEEEALAQGEIYAAAEINLRMWVDGPQRRPDDVDLFMREHVREMLMTALSLPPGMDEGRELGLQPVAINRLHEIRVPTLVTVGDLENPDTCNIAEILSADIAQARLQVIANTAHLPSLERPAEFNRILADFLADFEV